MLSRRVVGIAGALALSGCSFLKVDRPPKAIRRTDVFSGCTTEKTYPYLDIGLTVLAVVSAGLTYAGYVRTDDENDPTMKREMSTNERVSAGTFTLLQGGVFALSARWGFEQTARCRELQAKLASEPQPYPGQPYPGAQQQPYPAGPPQPYPAPQQQPYPAGPPQPYPAPPAVAPPPQPYPAPPAPQQQQKPGGAS